MQMTRNFGRMVAVIGISLFGLSNASADFVLDRQIFNLSPTTSSVDYVPLTVPTAGVVTFDFLSWEADVVTSTAVDVNGDGEIAFFDSMAYLFVDDGVLDAGDLVASGDDDDDDLGTGDGSISSLDTYLSVLLPAGDYLLATGAFFLSVTDATTGINTNSLGGGSYPITYTGGPFGIGSTAPSIDHGDYRLTVTGANFNGSAPIGSGGGGTNPVPAPGAALLAVFGMPFIGWAKRKLR